MHIIHVHLLASPRRRPTHFYQRPVGTCVLTTRGVCRVPGSSRAHGPARAAPAVARCAKRALHHLEKSRIPLPKETYSRVCCVQGVVMQVVRTPLGMLQQQSACPQCQGTGEIIDEYCGTCSGRGRVQKNKQVPLIGLFSRPLLLLTGLFCGTCCVREWPLCVCPGWGVFLVCPGWGAFACLRKLLSCSWRTCLFFSSRTFCFPPRELFVCFPPTELIGDMCICAPAQDHDPCRRGQRKQAENPQGG